MIKIKPGHFYKTRGGQKVGPMVKYQYRDVFHLPHHEGVNNVKTWWPDGRADFDKNDHFVDLVSEWVEDND